MNRYLKIIFAVVLFSSLTAGISFAIPIPVSFLDYIAGPSSAGWTHTLADNEFTPNLGAGDTINITDALLEIQMDFSRIGSNPPKLFTVSATGDTIFLATLVNNGPAGTVNNYLWSIDLDALGNAATVLAAINDKSFSIVLSAGPGSINEIDFARLSGSGTATASSNGDNGNGDNGNGGPGQQIPEPGTLLLLGSGLVGFGIFGRRKFRK